LHDGGVIISQRRIEAAACLFPLTQNPNVPKTMGTRHRAALGLSEETDAVILIVSEQTSGISIVAGGKMIKDVDPRNVAKVLEKTYMPVVRKPGILGALLRRDNQKEESE
jgi:diadenylate cyclase